VEIREDGKPVVRKEPDPLDGSSGMD
jgi:hypothetical protein